MCYLGPKAFEVACAGFFGGGEGGRKALYSWYGICIYEAEGVF